MSTFIALDGLWFPNNLRVVNVVSQSVFFISQSIPRNQRICTNTSKYLLWDCWSCPITLHRLAHELIMAHHTVKSPCYILALLRSSWCLKGRPSSDMANVKSSEVLYLWWIKSSQTKLEYVPQYNRKLLSVVLNFTATFSVFPVYLNKLSVLWKWNVMW